MADGKLNSDQPLRHAADDRLGFSRHATQLARAIADYVRPGQGVTPRSGMVISIEGAWGTGKSTYLNFLKEQLVSYSQNDELALVDFDPWWLNDGENIIPSFFRALVTALPSTTRAAVATAVAQLANASKRIPDWVVELMTDPEGRPNRIGKFLKGFKETGGAFDQWLSDGISPREARNRVAAELGKAKRGLVVFVDDLDRLEGHDTLNVLRFVKSMGDLPGVVYVLAFAPQELHSALSEVGIQKPEQFLEKIVQTSVQLPPPAKWRMRDITIESMNKTLGVSSSTLAADDRFEAIFAEYVTKPRDLARISNNIAIILGQVSGEIDPIDFACLQALRILDPELYAQIRLSRDLLTDSISSAERLAAEVSDTIDHGRKHLEEERRRRLLLDGERGKIRERALIALFPKCPLWNESPSEQDLRQRRSVALARYFDTYFALEVSPGVMSKAELTKVLSIANETELLSALKAIAGSEHGFDMISDFVDDVTVLASAEQSRRVASAFYVLDANFPASPMQRWELGSKIADFVAEQLRTGEDALRRGIIQMTGKREALMVSGPLAWLIARSSNEVGPQSQEDLAYLQRFAELMDRDNLGLFKAHYSRVIADIANSGQMLSVPSAPRYLRVWQAWDELAMTSWARLTVSSTSGLHKFIKAYANYLITKDVMVAYFETESGFRAAMKDVLHGDNDDMSKRAGYLLERSQRSES